MSTKNGVLQTDVPATPAPTTYTDAAQVLIDQTRAMRQQVPNFAIPLSKGDSRRLNSAASVPPEFVELTNVAVKNSAPLVRGDSMDSAQSRDLLSFADAFGPFADELEALAQFVRHSIKVAKNKAGSDALTTYALAKRLAKRPETADLVPHVDDMRRALGRVPKAKAKPAPAPATPAPKQGSSVTTESPDSASKKQ